VTSRFDLTLDESNSQRYRPRESTTKVAYVKVEACEYRLAWGTQSFSGPHVIVQDPEGNYGVDLSTFFETHEAISGSPNLYRKVAKVRAVQLTRSVRLPTRIQGAEEMLADVPAGAFIVQNPGGEQYAVGDDTFHRNYEPDD
jgi:hypothetical protein